ncbi:MAG: FtsQ-type POTRA domain-containing protein, partial [Pseudomonadota bacterium]
MPKVDPRAAHRHRAHATHSGVSRPDYDRDFSWPRLTNGKGQARKSRPTWFGKLRLLIGLIAIVLSGWAIAKASGLAPPAQAVIARAAQAVFVNASTGYNHLLDISGLRISQISVTGAQKTGSTAVFDALPVGKNANLFAFDATLAAQHVEALPWVERASITRVLPGQLHVHVQEETAAALWSLGDRLYLLNQQG